VVDQGADAMLGKNGFHGLDITRYSPYLSDFKMLKGLTMYSKLFARDEA